MCDGYLSPLTNWADSGRWSSDAGGGDAVLHGAGMAQLGGGSSSRDLWGSWGGVGWLALGCLRLGRQVQWLCTLTVLQKPKQHSFACCDHRKNLEAGGRGWDPFSFLTETTRNWGFNTYQLTGAHAQQSKAGLVGQMTRCMPLPVSKQLIQSETINSTDKNKYCCILVQTTDIHMQKNWLPITAKLRRFMHMHVHDPHAGFSKHAQQCCSSTCSKQGRWYEQQSNT